LTQIPHLELVLSRLRNHRERGAADAERNIRAFAVKFSRMKADPAYGEGASVALALGIPLKRFKPTNHFHPGASCGMPQGGSF
jgi:hypothetical protein